MGGAGPGPNGSHTWNSSDKSLLLSLSAADMTATAAYTNDYQIVRCTKNNLNTFNGGKPYWEILIDQIGVNNNKWYTGLVLSSPALVGGSLFYGYISIYAAYRINSQILNDLNWFTDGEGPGQTGAALSSFILRFALDIPSRKFFVGMNGVWMNSSNPVTGVTPSFYNMPENMNFSPFFATDSLQSVAPIVTLKSAVADFTYALPTGYTTLDGSS